MIGLGEVSMIGDPSNELAERESSTHMHNDHLQLLPGDDNAGSSWYHEQLPEFVSCRGSWESFHLLMDEVERICPEGIVVRSVCPSELEPSDIHLFDFITTADELDNLYNGTSGDNTRSAYVWYDHCEITQLMRSLGASTKSPWSFVPHVHNLMPKSDVIVPLSPLNKTIAKRIRTRLDSLSPSLLMKLPPLQNNWKHGMFWSCDHAPPIPPLLKKEARSRLSFHQYALSDHNDTGPVTPVTVKGESRRCKELRPHSQATTQDDLMDNPPLTSASEISDSDQSAAMIQDKPPPLVHVPAESSPSSCLHQAFSTALVPSYDFEPETEMTSTSKDDSSISNDCSVLATSDDIVSTPSSEQHGMLGTQMELGCLESQWYTKKRELVRMNETSSSNTPSSLCRGSVFGKSSRERARSPDSGYVTQQLSLLSAANQAGCNETLHPKTETTIEPPTTLASSSLSLDSPPENDPPFPTPMPESKTSGGLSEVSTKRFQCDGPEDTIFYDGDNTSLPTCTSLEEECVVAVFVSDRDTLVRMTPLPSPGASYRLLQVEDRNNDCHSCNTEYQEESTKHSIPSLPGGIPWPALQPPILMPQEVLHVPAPSLPTPKEGEPPWLFDIVASSSNSIHLSQSSEQLPLPNMHVFPIDEETNTDKEELVLCNLSSLSLSQNEDSDDGKQTIDYYKYKFEFEPPCLSQVENVKPFVSLAGEV